MKKKNIIVLLLMAGLLMAALLLIGDLSNYSSINDAKLNIGKEVSIICKIDTSKAMIYDAIKNPNFFRFFVTDSLGGNLEVVYYNSKPTDIEKTQRLVLKGKVIQQFNQPIFECKEILMKCPSKYINDGGKLINNKK